MSLDFSTGYLPQTPEEVPAFLLEYTQRIEEKFEDLHEQGRWIPELQDMSGNVATHTVQDGRFTRVSNMVCIEGRLTTSDVSGLSGVIRIVNLPFISDSAKPNGSLYGAIGNGFALTNGESVGGAIILNATHLTLFVWKASTGTVQMTAADWTDDGDFLFAGSYHRGN